MGTIGAARGRPVALEIKLAAPGSGYGSTACSSPARALRGGSIFQGAQAGAAPGGPYRLHRRRGASAGGGQRQQQL